MTGDASRFFSVRMSIVLTLFAAVLLSGMMVPSIAFGEETGVGHEAGAVDGGTQASTEAHGFCSLRDGCWSIAPGTTQLRRAR